MRKGIVMEQKKEYTIVMTHDGRFHRARRLNHAEVGMEVHFQALHEKHAMFRWTQVIDRSHFKVAIISLVLLLTFFPIYSWYGSNQAYAYVNIDINPSVELELNDKMQVLDISPKNERAEEVVEKLEDWKKRDASEVTFDMINMSREMGYVNSENQVLIGVSYIKSDQIDEYSKQMERYLSERSGGMTIATFLVPDQIRQRANESNQSVNAIMAKRINNEGTADSDKDTISVTVEDDDKEIIQSFYKNSSPSSEERESSVDKNESEPKSSPAVVKPDNAEAHKVQIKEDPKPGKGKETAPGQLKKQNSSASESSSDTNNSSSSESSAEPQNKPAHNNNENKPEKNNSADHKEKKKQKKELSKRHQDKAKNENKSKDKHDKQNDKHNNKQNKKGNKNEKSK
ncbi:anti-sigma factor domain-containing protein [Halobacillus sp. BBL2006]|uniref:anti-sigma factor domain-containing protein n=1 Tax=Halobacillus sp. BBL2006 TaxID=1543706 RepID=UPI00054282C9|nr:anti-sigma factor domain-containing protein [Halobacillus sp. BBL2006]KHE72328.1 hypothetical protein LD39_05110 [Halobacillus sp. BBL2006]